MANNTITQLQRAIEMKEKVHEFSAKLTMKMDDLENSLFQSVRAGFPEDIAATYHSSYYTPDRNIIDELSKDMLTRHVDFLERVIARLSSAGNQR